VYAFAGNAMHMLTHDHTNSFLLFLCIIESPAIFSLPVCSLLHFKRKKQYVILSFSVKCLHAAAAARSLRIRRVIHPSIVFDIVSVCVLTGFDTALGGESNEDVLPRPPRHPPNMTTSATARWMERLCSRMVVSFDPRSVSE